MNKPIGKATPKSVADIVCGDIITFRDLTTKEWRRGVVYQIGHPPSSTEVAGFVTIPVETVGLGKKIHNRYGVLWNAADSVVEQAGGRGGANKMVATFNLTTVLNRPSMTGDANRSSVQVVGSYSGSPFLTELLQKAKDLYHAKELFKDGKKIEPGQKVAIVPPYVGRDAQRSNRSERQRVFDGLRSEDQSAKPLKEKIDEIDKKISVPLGDVCEQGIISKRTYGFLQQATMPETGKAPSTLLDAYRLAVHTPEKLTEVFGLGSKGKMYREVIADVRQAATRLTARKLEATL